MSGAGHRGWSAGRAAAASLALMLGGHVVRAQTPAPALGMHAGVAKASADDIRDIRGPKRLAGGWAVPLMVLAGLSIGAAGYGGWFWSRRRASLLRSPGEVALEQLAAARDMIRSQDAREFSIEVSAIVRDYIERQFDVRAAHRTTDEFLHDLLDPSHRALTDYRGSLEGFLETCDLAKFGGWGLSAADMEALCDAAVRFVTESTRATAAAAILSPAPTALPTDPAAGSNHSSASALPLSNARNSHAAFPTT